MNISTGYNTARLAFATRIKGTRTHEGHVAVFDVKARAVQGSFPVRFDHGGNRLALSEDGAVCVVACYDDYGIAGYATADGAELWRRRDIRMVQQVRALPGLDAVFCGCEGGWGCLLRPKTGRTLEKYSGIKAVYPGPFNSSVLVSGTSLEVHSRLGEPVGSIERTTFTELDGAFSERELVITESGGDVRCFDLGSLDLLWVHSPPEAAHFKRLCYNQASGCIVGVVWRYRDRQDPVPRAVHFEPRCGAVLKEVALDGSSLLEFCLGGSCVFTADERLLSVETGQILHDFSKDSQHGTSAT